MWYFEDNEQTCLRTNLNYFGILPSLLSFHSWRITRITIRSMLVWKNWRPWSNPCPDFRMSPAW